tara:strand:+ start:13544 stop:15004 length:1461 start_codon:yes stop_codon:yes gene_type:complete
MNDAVSFSSVISNGVFSIGTLGGFLGIYDTNDLIYFQNLNSKIIGVTDIDDFFVCASESGELVAFKDELYWSMSLDSGIEFLGKSEETLILFDGAGYLNRINKKGNLIDKIKIGELSKVSFSKDGKLIAISLTNGTLIILDNLGNILQNSSPPNDDIETISNLEFRSDEILIVTRDSLGMALDERPENRIECWHKSEGCIHTSDLSSRVSVLLPTEDGAIAGCIDGSVIRLIVGKKEIENLLNFDYSISRITEWQGDLLVSSWFQVFRTKKDAEIFWSFEHSGLVTNILDLENGFVVIIGESPAGNNPSPLVIIDPNGEVLDLEPNNLEFTRNEYSRELSGILSDEEITKADAPPSFVSDTSVLIEELSEEIESNSNPEELESDILEKLVSSASEINLPPIADAGDDRTVSADEDGNAIVLLDGSRSYDPDGHIKKWEWQDSNSRVISETSQLNVKLPLGTHPFKLTVTDNKGASTTALVTIRISP